MPQQIQLRRGTSAAWASANPVLSEGEIGLELDTLAYKVGDGVTAWNTLLYRELSGEFSSLLLAAGAEPSAPSAGNLKLYAKAVGGRVLPKIIGPSGVDTILQEALSGNGIQILAPAASTAFSLFGMAAPTVVGTVSHPVISVGGLRQQTRRGIVTSAATANSAAELRNTTFQCFRGDAPDSGGFFFQCRFGVSSSTALQRCAVGLFGVTTAIATTQDPQALTNCIFAGWGSADTTLRLMHNDASGVCTQINLGASFPANTPAALYELTLFAAPNSANVGWRVLRLDTGDVAEGTISTDLPASTQFLAWHAYANNGGTAAAVILDIIRFYLSTDF